MAQIKYKETQRLRRWDLMALIGGLIVIGVVSLIQVLMNGKPNENVLLIMSLGILILSGLFYYLNSIRLIARYNEKNIKLSMLPVGTVKRKIKWADVAESQIVDMPRTTRWNEWNAMLCSLTSVITYRRNKCLHLRLKNNEVVDIGCNNPKELQKFVEDIKAFHPGIHK